MIQTKLKVSQSQKGFVGSIILFGSIEAGMILMCIISNPGYSHDLVLFNRILTVAFFVICFAAILTSLLFKVEVIDSTISVRTRIGRSFSFTLSEITKIVDDIYDDQEHGEAGIIRIKTTNRKFEILQTMNGFQEMAGYILEKLESGEINETAVSVSCKRRLRKYTNDEKMR